MHNCLMIFCFFFFNDPATTEIYTLSLHDALPISDLPGRHGAGGAGRRRRAAGVGAEAVGSGVGRSEEHTSELQSRPHLVCRLLLEKKKKNKIRHTVPPHTYTSTIQTSQTTSC